MNDIHKVTDKFHSILYADDTALVEPLCSFTFPLTNSSQINSECTKNVNLELRNISEWLSLNKLSLNVQKTKMMIFHNRQRNISSLIPNLEINGITIEHVKTFNFLGLILDEHLTWNSHIQKICGKIACVIGTMNRLKRFLPSFILNQIYNSLVLPHLTYSILTWGTKLKRVQKLQKWAVRTITNSKYNSHTDPLFRKLNLLKVQDIYSITALKFYYRYHNETLSSFFRNMFETTHPSHSYPTRNRDIPRLAIPHTSNVAISIRYTIPRLLLHTPACITNKIDTHSLQGFTKYTKKYLCSLYDEICHIPHCYICQ